MYTIFQMMTTINYFHPFMFTNNFIQIKAIYYFLIINLQRFFIKHFFMGKNAHIILMVKKYITQIIHLMIMIGIAIELVD